MCIGSERDRGSNMENRSCQDLQERSWELQKRRWSVWKTSGKGQPTIVHESAFPAKFRPDPLNLEEKPKHQKKCLGEHNNLSLMQSRKTWKRICTCGVSKLFIGFCIDQKAAKSSQEYRKSKRKQSYFLDPTLCIKKIGI